MYSRVMHCLQGDSPLWGGVKWRLSSMHGVEWRLLRVGEMETLRTVLWHMAKSTSMCKVGLGMRMQ